MSKLFYYVYIVYLIIKGTVMKSFLFICIFNLLLFAGIKNLEENIYTNEHLNNIANSIKPYLPMMVDDETRLDSIHTFEKNLKYVYTLVNVNQSDFTQKSLENILKPKVRNSVCTNPVTMVFPKNKVVLTFSYYSKTGRFISEFSVKPEDCNF